MKKRKYTFFVLIVLFMLSTAFSTQKIQVVSYWFDLDGVFQAGPSEAVAEINRIDIPDLKLRTSACTTCHVYEIGYTSISSNNGPEGNCNQCLYYETQH